MSKIHWPARLCRQRGRLSGDRSFWSDERGVTAVVVGLVVTLVIAVVGLGADGGAAGLTMPQDTLQGASLVQ